jgi:hypothetical protein
MATFESCLGNDLGIGNFKPTPEGGVQFDHGVTVKGGPNLGLSK